MLKNSNTIKSWSLRSENDGRVIANAVTKNYLKPTAASLKRNRFVLADVTTKANSRSKQTSNIIKQNSIKKPTSNVASYSYKTTHANNKTINNDNNKYDNTLSLRNRQIEYQEKTLDSNILLKKKNNI